MSFVYNAVINGESKGPFDINALRLMAQSGMINQDTLVWREGMSEWQKISAIPDLYSGIYGAVQLPPPIPAGVQNGVGSKNNSNSHAVSIVGFICSIMGLIVLFAIQCIPFEIDPRTARRAIIFVTDLDKELGYYPIWIGGLIIGSAFVILATWLVIRSLIKNHSDVLAIVGAFICVISLVLAGYSFTKLKTKAENYKALKDAKEEIVAEEDINNIIKHNQDIADILSEIDF